MSIKEKIAIFWFRRDLRLFDNAGLFHALNSGFKVLPVFIFDENILSSLSKSDARISFIHGALEEINKTLKPHNSQILISYGAPLHVFQLLLNTYDIKAVYTNSDYEPYAIQRDIEVGKLLNNNNIEFFEFKDQVIFEKGEVLKPDKTPYTVFTPYSKIWKQNLNEKISIFPSINKIESFASINCLSAKQVLENAGFHPDNQVFKINTFDGNSIINYEKTRDFPAQNGTSRLSVHLRFGTVSIRELVQKAIQYNQTWLNELIWREFFKQILFHFPYVEKGAFKPKYNFIPWRNDEKDFEKWCNGQTGYPIVDAGMRELNATGFMHNRVRMITASFLTKHLLINWQWGEAYFAEKLLDFELSANNGNWQWASGSGCDSAPYFRIFNPTTQAEKFDKELKYIRTWVPEVSTAYYVKPMVEHTFARERCLSAYKSVL